MEFEKASEIFDLYIDWNRRLAREIPPLVSRFQELGARKIADAACGSGFHAVALAEAGLDVTAIDPLPSLLAQAKRRASEREVAIRLQEAFLHQLPTREATDFDGVICVGNSISLIAPGAALIQAFNGLAGLLRPGGHLFLHTINYPMLSQRQSDPFGPVRVLENGALILKGFLPRTSGTWDALFVHLEEQPSGGWDRRTYRFCLHPHTKEEITEVAEAAGLQPIAVAGGFAGESPDDPHSADLLYEFSR